MADLAINPANVQLVSGQTQQVKATTPCSAGQPVYQDSTGGYNPAASGSAYPGFAATALAIDTAAAGQPLVIALPGAVVKLGAVVTVNQMYIVSANAGNIAPSSDLTSAVTPCFLGFGLSSTSVQLVFSNTTFVSPWMNFSDSRNSQYLPLFL